jgi:peptide deformylase
MSLREIVTVPHPVLKRKARKVTDFGPELQKLVEDMVETMRDAPGVGLAAPQINVPLRVVVIEYGDDEEEKVPPKLYTIINPEFTRKSKETVLGTEGCLSIPGVLGDVERYEALTVKAQNRYGQPMTLKVNGWLARIFQHEVDHLDGVLFTELAEKVWQVDTETTQVSTIDNV